MILVHSSCQISDLSHIETVFAICKIGFMMLWDHAHPYIQSSTVLCDNTYRDFRPAYQRIHELRALIPKGTPFMACTATATKNI